MFRSKSVFEKTLDKATSNLLLEPDLDSMLQLCDMIRAGDVKTRDAGTLIKNRVIDETNPNQKLLAVAVLDTAMKNCGEKLHQEIITETFMERLKELLRNTRSDILKNKLLEMIQCWGLAFRGTQLNTAFNLYNILKAEGYSFPTEKNTNDFFKSESAPVWREGDECSSCKTEFGVVTRKHHCRACGGIFCSKCTSKQAIIPKFGIEKEVRVCDSCFVDLTNRRGGSSRGASARSGPSRQDSDLPIEYLQSALFKEGHDPPKKTKTEAELKEEEELQLAMALSLDEQTNRAQIQRETVASSNSKRSSPVGTPNEDVDPDLAHYFDRAYWEKKKEKQNQQQTYAQSNGRSSPANVVQKADDTSPQVQVVKETMVMTSEEDKKFLTGLRTSVEIFLNRMRSNQIRGRSISNDSAVQTLFQSVNSMHPRIMQMLNELEETRLKQEALQDKLTQMKDARAALDALRHDHSEKLRREAEEAERVRQIQMAHKLHIMRQKKQEFLAHQRQQALQRMQEQEAARKVKLEQQKQYIQQRALQNQMGYQANDPAAPSYAMNYYGPQDIQQQQMAPGTQAYSPNQYQGNYNPNMQPVPYQTNNNQQPMMYGQAGSYPPAGVQQDYYNMQGMQIALPQQHPVTTAGMAPNAQHIVASAPPQTPQPAYQQIAANDPGAYQQMQQQPTNQQVATTAPAGQQGGAPQGSARATESQQNLLISFD